ncbi:hypothetical protein MKX07_007281 [Trichoderma sp. CBMAI-0711]|uniref:Uncharacterized protein n=1 Tax=Trichoderma parareesei TaxID=858221 RepID=A0A2H2ZGZ0_TRIPA|nr:hypothetical protein MKX07_007281 [Trichoderma sp. CBMAI-0711]OTA05038.1 hypothetical protein A9Z42_0056600 [Trichoderma parareesei]
MEMRKERDREGTKDDDTEHLSPDGQKLRIPYPWELCCDPTPVLVIQTADSDLQQPAIATATATAAHGHLLQNTRQSIREHSIKGNNLGAYSTHAARAIDWPPAPGLISLPQPYWKRKQATR